VTDFPAAAPQVGRAYCPACEPSADPIREILDVRGCEAHAPGRDGVEDGNIRLEAFGASSSEVGGADNRRWCDLIHRRAS
jgi:hypothetical protein